MKIDKITLRRCRNPIKRPYITSFGPQTAFDSILVALESDGVTGWGEAAPGGAPLFSPYTDLTSFIVARDFIAPQVRGRSFDSPDELDALLDPIRGNPYAKAAFDVALRDLFARRRGEPLYRAIGGVRNTAAIGYTFGVLGSFDELLAGIDRAVRLGYPRVKLKFCPGWECDMLDAVRAAFPDLTIHIDCNSAYTLDDLPMLKKLDRYRLAMIEQPLMHDDLIDHAALQKQIDTPICLDESIVSFQSARQAVEIGACRFINIKYARVGGLGVARRIHDLCGETGTGCWLGGMGESAFGTAVVAALATLPHVNYPSDISPADKFYAKNLGRPLLADDTPGTYTLRERPGLDVEPDWPNLDEFTVEKLEFHAEK